MRSKAVAITVWLLACLVALAGGAWAGSRWFASPRPLGAPLPPPKPAIFTIIPREQADEASWMKRITLEAWLEYLAPQPDGLPPLRWPFHSEWGDYSMSLPQGSSTTFVMDVDDHGIITDAWGQMNHDWPLRTFVFQMCPRKEGETVEEFTARYQSDLMKSGVKLIGNLDPVLMPEYKFQHFEYHDPEPVDGVTYSRYVYVGPFGSRVLVQEYICPFEFHEQARGLVNKILNSFEPGWELKKIMLHEDPDYGDLAGGRIAEQPINLPAAQ